MTPMTSFELLGLRDLVRDHWAALAIVVYGPESIAATQEDIDRLVAAGILDPAAVHRIDPIEDAYLLGFGRQRMEQAGYDVEDLSLADFREIVARDPMPLTSRELDAIGRARTWGGQYVTGLGDAVARQIIGEAVGIEREQAARAAIGDEVADALANRRTADALATRLADQAGGWARDWTLVAQTEMTNAREAGSAADIAETFGDDARVAKIPNPDACPDCLRLYTTDGTTPRVFALKELVANGTNRGRKRADWLPTVDALHPRCHCTLVSVPPGFAFDDDGTLQPEESIEGAA